MSNGSKTSPTDASNVTPDRHASITDADREAAHAAITASGHAPCTHPDHNTDCDVLTRAFASHAASARAEEREAKGALLAIHDLASARLRNLAPRNKFDTGARRESDDNVEHDLTEIARLADAISRRSP